MRKVIQFISFLGLVLVFGGVSANAQRVTNVDANVPFDFVIGDRSLPAGEYVLRIVSTPGGAQRLEVSNQDREVVYKALMMTNGDRNKFRSELVFDRSSGQAVLAKILTEDVGYSLPQPRSEKLIARGRGSSSDAVKN